MGKKKEQLKDETVKGEKEPKIKITRLTPKPTEPDSELTNVRAKAASIASHSLLICGFAVLIASYFIASNALMYLGLIYLLLSFFIRETSGIREKHKSITKLVGALLGAVIALIVFAFSFGADYFIERLSLPDKRLIMYIFIGLCVLVFAVILAKVTNLPINWKKPLKKAEKEKNAEKQHIILTKVQWFFTTMFLISVGFFVYSYLRLMFLLMGLGAFLLAISLLGYKLGNEKSGNEKEIIPIKAKLEKPKEMTKEENKALEDQYTKMVSEGNKEESSFREIRKQKREEERYLKKREKMKLREESLRRKEELKAKKREEKEKRKLVRAQKRIERYKERKQILLSEREKLEQRKELLEYGKKMAAKKEDETDLDQLYDFVQKFGLIKLNEIMEIFGVSKEVATRWMGIFEQSKLAEIHYPAMGIPELRRIKLENAGKNN